MNRLKLSFGDFFDQAAPLESALDLASTHFNHSTTLNTSLTSLLIWQNEFVYTWAVKENIHFILAQYGSYVYLPVPPQPLSVEALNLAFDYMKLVNGRGTGVSRIEGFTDPVNQIAPPYLSRPTMTEYIYDRKQVAGLHGDPFRSQRALVNHFLKTEQVLFRPYRFSDLKACSELFEKWKTQRLPIHQGQMGEKMILSSQKAHYQALIHNDTWNISVWVVLVGNRLSAYTAGTPLNPDTYGVLLEVSDLEIKGLSSYVFSTLCRQLKGYTYVNTGDAEGLPRLAKSKEHWHPLRKISVYAADSI